MHSIGASATFSVFNSMSLLTPNKAQFSLTSPLCTFSSRYGFFLSSSQQSQRAAHLSFSRRHNGLLLFSVSAANSRRRKGATEVMEMDGSDFDDGDEEFDFGKYGDGDGDDDDEDEGMFLPLEKMKKWLENKPSGFGEGKVYDTSIEDKLLEEMEQSRQAQIVNVNKLKNEPVESTSSKKEDHQITATPSGIRVRLINLPKKKNVHRDLKDAFEGVPGIINISPAVSGNKKTRDPICRGFAFVDFKSEKDAARFVQTFSEKSISFGKIHKQIKCEIMNAYSSKSVNELSSDNAISDTEITVSHSEEDPYADSDTGDVDDDSLNSWVDVTSGKSIANDDLDPEELEDTRKNLESVSVLEVNGGDKVKRDKKAATVSVKTNRQKKIRNTGKKSTDKENTKKAIKLEVPGSAKRLKVKEKAMLTDVFSKYAAGASVVLTKES